MTTKPNGDPLEGTIAPPLNYPNPVDNNVNMHPMDWAYRDTTVEYDHTSPAAPSALVLISSDATTAHLSWTAATDNVAVAFYDVYKGGVLNQSVAITTATVTGLVEATAYAFTVKARDAHGNVSAASNTLNVTPDATAPSAPTLSSPSNTSTTVALSWTASTDNVAVTFYDVFKDAVLNQSVASPGLVASVTGLTTATQYAFTVKARDAKSNSSAASNTVTVTTA